MRFVLFSYLDELDLEYERPHLRDPGGGPLEALQVVGGQDEEALLPPAEDGLVALLPHQALPDGRGPCRRRAAHRRPHRRAHVRARLEQVQVRGVAELHLGDGLAKLGVGSLQVHAVGGLKLTDIGIEE